MSDQERLTGYTTDEKLKSDVQRTVNSESAYDSESELVIHAVRKLLGEAEAEEKAAEYNVERRIERKIDEMDRTIEETITTVLDETEFTTTNNDTDTADSSDGTDGTDGTASGNTSDGETASDESSEPTNPGIDWADRDDDGDWR
jgi:Arc/MetJ-type ribon-helix-helix transcriptional regulator